MQHGDRAEFKVTLGRWDRVEKDSLGRDIPNRQISEGDGGTGGGRMQVDVQGWGQPYIRPHTVQGEIHYHDRFYSHLMGNLRTLSVWLPPDYATDPSRRFPVLYMHDGQNLFDAARSAFGSEWEVDEAAMYCITRRLTRSFIVVGIDNTSDRFGEYTPTAAGGIGGRGPLYGRAITEEMIPFVDAYYRTLDGPANTFVAGSSLGGLISLYLVRQHPQTFGGCAALSPSLWWDNEALLRDVEREARWAAGKRVWVDIGTAEEGWGDEGSHVARTLRMRDALVRAGLKLESQLACHVVDGAHHTESAWALRMPDVLQHLFSV
jgi:predicted alpha/beta superfamily hydrolase